MERWFYDQETEEHVLMVPGPADGSRKTWVETARVPTRLSAMRRAGRSHLAAAQLDDVVADRLASLDALRIDEEDGG